MSSTVTLMQNSKHAAAKDIYLAAAKNSDHAAVKDIYLAAAQDSDQAAARDSGTEYHRAVTWAQCRCLHDYKNSSYWYRPDSGTLCYWAIT